MAAVNGAGATEAPRASEAGRYDAFISYAHEDSDFVVGRLLEALRERGQRVWLDLEITGGARWRERVLRAIEACKALIFVISPASVASGECSQELDDAVALNKKVIPIVYRDNDGRSLPSALADAEWVFLRAADDFSAGMDRLVEALETDLQWRDQHTRLAGRAREWVDSGRNASYLLRGADLRAAEAWQAQQEGHREALTREHREYIARSRQAAGRRVRTMVGALSAGLIIAIGLTIVAVIQRNQAVSQSDAAQSQEMAAEATNLFSANVPLAMLLSLQAYERAQTLQARSALIEAAGQPLRDLLAEGSQVSSVAFSPNGHTLAVGDNGGDVGLWDTTSGRRTATLA
ncbi:MAG: TIR domain-containing protein, partial [Streptosporangiaceae bacterium]